MCYGKSKQETSKWTSKHLITNAIINAYKQYFISYGSFISVFVFLCSLFMSKEACINRKINHYFLTDTLFIFLILCFVAMGGLRMSEKQLFTNFEEKDQQHYYLYIGDSRAV